MLGLRGHSAALMKPLKSSFLRVHAFVLLSYSGGWKDGESVAYSCTWVSMVKLLMAENDSSRGDMYCLKAASISQDEGVDVGVNKEKVKW